MNISEEYNKMNIQEREIWFLSCNYQFTEEYAKTMSVFFWNGLSAFVQKVLTQHFKDIS